MKPLPVPLIAAGIVAIGIASASCDQATVFNENCPTSRAVVGTSAVPLDVSKRTVRSEEAPIGDLIADALLDADVGAAPVAALENSGSIRPELCGGGTRDQIPAGNITETDVENLLPFENYVYTVTLRGDQLKSTLERAVSSLPDTTDGWFLQVSGISFSADCSRQRQVLSADGTQIVTEGDRVDAASIVVGGLTWSSSGTYAIATNDFVASGQDGFLAMNGAPQTATAILATDALRSYLSAHSPVAPPGTGRITLTGCTPP